MEHFLEVLVIIESNYKHDILTKLFGLLTKRRNLLTSGFIFIVKIIHTRLRVFTRQTILKVYKS